MKNNNQGFSFGTKIIRVIVAIIVTVASSIIVWYFTLFQQSNIIITGSYHPFKMPSYISNSLDEYSTAIQSDRLEGIATNSGRLSLEEFKPYSFMLYEYLSGLSITKEFRQVQRYESFWIFTVENKASNKIENATLILPFDGYFELLKEESEVAVQGKYKNKIDIGDLKPTNIARVKVWSSRIETIIFNKPYFYDGSEPRLTFNNGSKKVIF